MEQLQAFYNKKRVLITGGAGFIGSHLTEKLVSLGAQVTILDNFSTGCLSNLKSVVHAISILYADIRSSYSCTKATLKQDIVFHLAAFVSVPESVQNPRLCMDINTLGTHNLLNGCLTNKVPTFIFASSSAIYGNKNGICTESDTPSPETPYAISKYEAEILCQRYAQEYGINTASLRYFNVYGDRQRAQGSYAAVVAKFKSQLLAHQPITIFGDGQQTRDFINVNDIIQANILAGMNNNLHGDVFNVGSGKSINLFELIQQLEDELKTQKTDVRFLPARQGDIVHSQANCEKYKSLF